jgi:predicted DNA-binding transcriptional regulator AlpA
MKTKTIRLNKIVELIGLSYSGAYKYIIKDSNNNTLSGYDAETEL